VAPPLILLLGLAVPAVRNYVVDAVLYQTLLPYAPQQEATTVERPIHFASDTVMVQVLVRRGTLRIATFRSPLLRRAPGRQIWIYLPPGYDEPVNWLRRYPVVYLLHGAPGGPADWTLGGHATVIADEMIAAGQIQPLILAMPDGNGGKEWDTEYVNKFDGTDNEMDYLAKGAVPWVDAHFRTLRAASGRALGGLSMGGYGAFNVGLHHPEVWRTLFSISGYFTADRAEVFGANDPLGHDPRFLRANSPTHYVAGVPRVRRMHLLILDSTADWGGYTQQAEAFDRELTRLGIPHTLDLHRPTGLVIWDHSWSYWQLALRHALSYASHHYGH
jgi:S-formylglutathione hydrolase FrmB